MAREVTTASFEGNTLDKMPHCFFALSLARIFLVAQIWAGTMPGAAAFLPADRWEQTAQGQASTQGKSIALTWSLIPDGTALADGEKSQLVAYLDSLLGFTPNPTDTDLELRPWFPLVESTFERWSELGGVHFTYESQDDGSRHRAFPGELGIRGDIRLAAENIDGPGGTLATTQFPDTGDILLDSAEIQRLGNPEHEYLRLRNTLMHEIGHALGLAHIASSDAQLLMELALNVSFEGPQLDDIRGLHHLYGDRLEQSGGGLGNDSRENATILRSIQLGETWRLGSDARGNQHVVASENDFLSISNSSDLDFFRFTAPENTILDVHLLPLGGEFLQGLPGSQELLTNANSTSDLTLQLQNAEGSILAMINQSPRGEPEELANFQLPSTGDYYLRVSGTSSVVQLYELRIDLQPAAIPEPCAVVIVLMVLLLLSVCERKSFTLFGSRASRRD